MINQEIKKKEINKFLKNASKEEIVEQYLDDLILRLNLKDIDSLMKQLIMNNSYSINEIKKKN